MKGRLISVALTLPLFTIILLYNRVIFLFHALILAISIISTLEIFNMAKVYRQKNFRTVITTIAAMVLGYVITICGTNILHGDFSRLYKFTQINNISIIKNIYTDKSIKYISKVVSKITENDNFIVLLAVINDDKANLVYASSKNLKVKVNDLLKDSIKLIDGNGGGTHFMAQGGGKNNGNIENTLNYALSKLEKFIG